MTKERRQSLESQLDSDEVSTGDLRVGLQRVVAPEELLERVLPAGVVRLPPFVVGLKQEGVGQVEALATVVILVRAHARADGKCRPDGTTERRCIQGAARGLSHSQGRMHVPSVRSHTHSHGRARPRGSALTRRQPFDEGGPIPAKSR